MISTFIDYYFESRILILTSLIILILFILNIYKKVNSNNNNKAKLDSILRKIRKERNSRIGIPLYPNGWIPVLESSDISVNEVKPVIAFGQELVAFRGKSGNVYIADAFCPHLGANLGYGGQVVKNECIQCPFHEWTFRGSDGRCDSIPDIESSDSLLTKAKLNVWQVYEVNNVIFVWYHSRGDNPDWFPDKTNATLISGSKVEIELNCHIQDIGENAADFAHFLTMHRPLIFPTNDFMRWLSKYFYNHMVLDYHLLPEKHKSIGTLDFGIVLFGITIIKTTLHTELVGPAYARLSTVGLMNTTLHFAFIMTPIMKSKVRFIHRIYSEPSIISRIITYINGLSVEAIISRDFPIWNNKIYRTNPLMSRNDRSISLYRRWFKQFY